MYAFRKAPDRFPWSKRHRLDLDDPGVIARINLTEIIGRIGRNGLAAIRAVAHVDVNGHAARLTADSVAVIATIRYRTWSEAHGGSFRFLSLIIGRTACLFQFYGIFLTKIRHEKAQVL